MLNRGLAVDRPPGVMKVPPLITAHPVLLEVPKQVLGVISGKILKQPVKGPPTHEGIPIPESLLGDGCDLLLGQ